MKIRTATLALAALIALPAAAAAQQPCGEEIDRVAGQLPDLSAMSPAEASEATGLSEEQLEALVATLDAARLAQAAGETEGCMTMVGVAEDMVEKGSM